MSERISIEKIQKELLIASEQQAEALRSYLEEEERRRKADQLLEQRLNEKATPFSFSI
jgi:hypothetical protein